MNVYFGLQTGWSIGGSIIAAILSFSLFSAVRATVGGEGAFPVVQFAGVRSDASADEVAELVASLGDAGATSVPFLPLDADGEPETGDGILRLATTIAAARERLA